MQRVLEIELRPPGSQQFFVVFREWGRVPSGIPGRIPVKEGAHAFFFNVSDLGSNFSRFEAHALAS